MKIQGFTLIEVLVTLSITAILIGAGFIISIDAYRDSIFEREKNTFIQILEKARSEAINNIDQNDHGVKVNQDDYTIFYGDKYSPTALSNEKIGKEASIKISGDQEVIFQNLSGNTIHSATFILSDNNRSITLTVNSNGRINY